MLEKEIGWDLVDPLLLLVGRDFPVLETGCTVLLQLKNLSLNIYHILRNLNYQNNSAAGSMEAEISSGCKQFCIYCLLFPCFSALCTVTSCSVCPKAGPKALHHQHFWWRPCMRLLWEWSSQRQRVVTWGEPWAVTLYGLLTDSPCSCENACHKSKM